MDRANVIGFPVVLPNPLSPVHKHLKFRAVRGTTSSYNLKTISPAGLPPMLIAKNTSVICKLCCRYPQLLRFTAPHQLDTVDEQSCKVTPLERCHDFFRVEKNLSKKDGFLSLSLKGEETSVKSSISALLISSFV